MPHALRRQRHADDLPMPPFYATRRCQRRQERAAIFRACAAASADAHCRRYAAMPPMLRYCRVSRLIRQPRRRRCHYAEACHCLRRERQRHADAAASADAAAEPLPPPIASPAISMRQPPFSIRRDCCRWPMDTSADDAEMPFSLLPQFATMSDGAASLSHATPLFACRWLR